MAKDDAPSIHSRMSAGAQAPVKAAVIIQGSDRHLQLLHHDGDVLTLTINFGEGLSLAFGLHAQELADAFERMDFKLPKPSKDAASSGKDD